MNKNETKHEQAYNERKKGKNLDICSFFPWTGQIKITSYYKPILNKIILYPRKNAERDSTNIGAEFSPRKLP